MPSSTDRREVANVAKIDNQRNTGVALWHVFTRELLWWCVSISSAHIKASKRPWTTIYIDLLICCKTQMRVSFLLYPSTAPSIVCLRGKGITLCIECWFLVALAFSYFGASTLRRNAVVWTKHNPWFYPALKKCSKCLKNWDRRFRYEGKNANFGRVTL